MKVLVTGGAGFIGSHVADGLIEHGHQVVVVDNLSTGSRENLNPKATFHEVDIRSPELAGVFEKERPDVVDHHAAQMSVKVSVQNPREDADINVLGGLNVIECSKDYGVKKIVYASTGGAMYGEPQYLPCDVNHPINPLSQYGVTKHNFENYLFTYRHLYGLNYTVLRYPNVYGPRQDPYGEAGVVAIFTGQMLEGKQTMINGSGEQERDFVYVADVAEANLLALDKGDNDVFNIGWGHGTSVNQIFQALAEITGYGQDAEHGPALPGEVFKICLDAGKANRELGWAPRTPFEEGLRQTVDYFRQKRVA
ncbi:MAG: NAD-dependent epimerase/dehydratase family protein [Dehalococcoidia bacterium]|nr:NAD-dependent epimerase/dehydratase family protein [Dehalococcoidia bacterium]